MWNCDQCGECCRNLDQSALYEDLDRGDGVCLFLKGNRCSIYKERPLLCRVSESYEVYFKNVISRSKYDRLNLEGCLILKQKKEN
ncbi:MAG: YkgJ family cysteine cluster protein [Eubacteriaceae bacterium]